MKTINCPICGQANVISQSEYKQITRPGTSALSTEGGEWDYSHAQKCAMLAPAKKKEYLLAYHVHGRPTPITLSDYLSFDDYNEQLKQYGLEIGVSLKRLKRKWRYEAFIKEKTGLERKRLFTVSNNPNQAFDYLRHRLLCGEPFSFESGPPPPFRQLLGATDGKSITVIKL